MNGYAIIFLSILFVILISVYDLGPAIKQLFYTLVDIPMIDVRRVRDPAVFAVAVRAMYLIVLVGIIKLFLNRRKDDEDV
ncbi:hypothetical protein C6A37_01145 [Desulfobacteraceae bacterium SEEP-SAG9]|nr:hypothetical protein C6A37_01145 [Desulfobacteraceae bacterium SEEP-SAG9]